MKSFLKVLCLAVFAAFSAFFFSCDVGLGETVDVMAPIVSITYPPASSIIREKFCLYGSWTDDKGVMLIQVTVKNTDTGKTVYSGNASVGSGNWNLTLNTPDENGKYPFPDGKYTVDVVAVDTSKRVSSTSSRGFEIDNTPPVFVIKNPGSKDIETPSSYGSIFKMNGSIAEAHSVKTFKVTVYDPDSTDADGNPMQLAEWTESNVNTAGGTSVTFARYDESKADELHNNYAGIYTKPDSSGNQSYYCSVLLSDNAGIYRTPGNDTSDSDEGNVTTALWLNDSIYGTDAGTNDLLSKNANPQYEIGDLLKIINGTYSGSGDVSKALSVLEATKIDTTQNGNCLAFRLNKDASPTYNFLGYSFTDSAAANKAAAGNTITFKAECGRNETQFKPKTIKMYLIGPFVSVGNVYPITDDILNSVYGDVETYLENKTEGTDYYLIYNGEESYKGVSVSSWTETVKLPDDIQTGSYYLLAATGTDMDSIEFTPNDGARYGFAGVSQGIPPSFDLSDETKANVAVDHKNLDFLTLSGKVSSSDSDIRSVSYVINVTDLENQSKLVGTITGSLTQNFGITSGTLSSSRTIEFNVDAADLQNSSYTAAEDYSSVDARNVSALNDIRYKYEIELIGEDSTGTQGTVNLSCVLDKIAPVVTVSSVTPYVAASESTQKDRLNGIVTVTLKVTEANLKSLDVTVSCDDGSVSELTDLLETKVTQGTNTESTLLAKFDTAHFADNTNIKINVTAIDNAGNETLIVNDDYIADQTSDLPVITVQNGAVRTEKTSYFKADGTTIDTYTESDGTTQVSLKETNMFTDSGMLVSVTDDDGIDSAWVEYKEKSAASFGRLGSVQKGKGKTSLTFTADVHKLATGEYEFRVIAKDVKGEISVKGVKQTPAAVTNYVPSADGYFIVVVDKDIPKISVEGSGDYKSENQDITVDGKISDSTGVVKIIKSSDSEGNHDVENVASLTDCVSQKGWTFDTTTGTETGSIYFVATDKYGRSSFVEYIYVIDKDAPTVYPGWTDENSSVETYESGATFHKNNTFTFKIPLSDEWINNAHDTNVSGIESVSLKIKNTDASGNETESEAVMSRAEAKAYIYSGTTYPSIFYYYAVTHTFSDGTNKVWITAKDKAGNELSYKDSSPYTFKVDVKSPELEITSPATVNDYELAKPTFTGNATDGNFKELKVTYKRTYAEYDSTTKKVKNTASDGNVTVPVAADGSWIWTVPGDGNYANLKFMAYDEANNYTTSDVYNFTVDVTNIKLLSVAGTADWKNSATQTLKVLAGDWGSAGTAYSSGIEEVAFTRANPDSTNASGTLTQGGLRDSSASTSDKLVYYEYNATFSDLADGQTSFTVTAKDAAGRTQDSSLSVSYNIDTKAPSVTAGIGSIGTAEFKRVKTDTAASYEIKLAADDTNGTLSVSGLKEVSVKKNNTAIKLYTSSAVSGTGADSITLNSTASELTKIESSSPVSFWIKASDIAQGINEFTINVKDHAGNTGSATVKFYYDSTLPKVEYTSHAAEATVNKTITLSGTVSEEKTVYITADNENNSGIDTSAVKVQWSSNGSAWTDLTSGTDYTAVNFTNSDTAWEITGLDTTKLNATAIAADRYVRLLVVDKYGNSNTNSIKLNVDQNADRPVIELSTITAMDDVIPLRKVSGTISDDDGGLNSLKMWIIESSEWNGTSVPTAGNANGWTSVTVNASGTWSADAAENAHSWLFYVIDKNGGTFWTHSAGGDSLLEVPYITYGTTTKADNTSALAFKVDTQAPQITMYISNQALAADDSAETDSSKKWKSAGTVFGGTENKLYIKLEVVEQNMKTATGTVYELPSLKIGTNSQSVSLRTGTSISGSGTESDPYIYLLSPITLAKATYSSMEGSVTVKATLDDQSGQEGQGGTNIILDYSAPQVGILSPTATISDAVNAAVTVKGTVLDDYSSIEKLEYAIPLTGATYSESAGSWASILASSAAWELAFTSGSEESPDSLLYYASAVNVAANKYVVEEIETGLGIYKVPVYFRATDSVGNIAVNKDCYVYVDPNGGKPKAWINAPEQGTVTSGTVTIYGGASDNISVSKVCVQIDVNGDGAITEADYTAILASPEDYISEYSAGMLVASTSAGNDWYILAGGTNSWKCPIVTGNLASYTGTTGTVIGTQTVTNGKKYLVARVRAIDGDNLTRSYTDSHCITIDNTAPWFTDLAVVQYGSGVTPGVSSTPIVEREYISGMYISNNSVADNGSWYLTGYVKSNTDITSIEANPLSSTSTVVIDLPDVSTSNNTVQDKTGAGTTDGYKLLIPLTTDSSGMIYSELRSVNGAGTGNQTVKINIDSTAPSLYTTAGAESTTGTDSLRLKSLSKMVGTDLASNSVIENSDGYFTFGDNVIEAGSGLQFIAFYLQNEIGNKVYDPMKTQSGTAISGSKTANALYINSDNLAAFYVTGATRTTPYSITHSRIDSDHVRAGGLVKIGGSYHTITDVTGTTVTFSPAASTSFTDAEFIYAQVVDHQITEYFDIAYDQHDDAYYTLMNDDGDLMCETITQIGTTYQWTASVDSTNIPDGRTYIRVVAMDNAGNLSYGRIESIVANNRPRMTKVFIGTDLNSSGKYDFDADEAPVVSTSSKYRTASGTCYGEFNYYTAYNTRSGIGQSAVTLASSEFKVVNGLCVVPEFVGGNGSLKYNFAVNDTTTTANNSVSLTAMSTRSELSAVINEIGSVGMFGTVNSTDTDGNTNPVAYSGTDIGGTTYYDFGGVIIPQNRLSGATSVKLSFWDETDSSSGPSFDGQWATLVIPFANMSDEIVPPVPVINPFYWKGSGDNSVYIDSVISGHIELEGSDLPTDSSYTSGLPKVSGKIKIEGTVTDNVLVKSITMSVFGSSKTVATYSNGTWTQASSLPTGVVSFTATDKELSQNGHTVSYVAVIDTEQLSVSGYPVGKNQKITISATDWNSNASSAGSTQTASDALTDCYKMDVVPYVTEIVTHLSSFYKQAPSVYARTALGHYPVYEGETIQFAGYNLGTNKANITISGMSATTLASGTVGGETVSNTVTLTKNTSSDTGAKSGSVSVTVNSIPALNNLNENDALGSYQGSVSDDSYANAYNRQPNGVNNNTLTDDLYLDVWQFKNAAEPVSGGASYVTMKINPKTGIPGFSYANSILYFNMPGYNANNSSSSYGTDNATITGSSYSQIPFGMNYGGFSHNSFTFDSYGYAYGAAMCTDTQSATASAFLQFFSRETPIPYNTYDQNMNYVNCANASRLDSSSVQVSSGSSGWTTDIDRIQSISMDTSYSGGSSTAPTTSNPVYVFMAYYDQPVKQVRFRWGTVGGATDNIDGKKNSSSSSISSSDRPSSYTYGLDDVVGSKYTGYAQSSKTDGGTRPKEITESYRQYSTSHSSVPIQIVAASGVSGAMTEYASAKNGGAGKYVSLSIAKKDTANPVAIVTWYDSVNMALKMAYNTAPTTSSSWTVRTIDSNGGINVKTAVDKDNHIHFAYYDNINGSDLKYAYLDSYDSTSDPTIVTVDSFSAVGAKCTIDVAKDSDGNWVPYIGYQLSSYLGTPLGAKVAYRTDFTSLGDGATKDMYTGQWECSIVPTQNIPNDDQINVGVRRDENGFAKKFRDSDYWSSGDTAPGQTITNGTLNVGNATILHGNNTKNPIIGYGIDTGAIEMAQKK